MDNKNNRTDAEEAIANKASGTWNQVKGNVKEAWGDLTNDPATKREGIQDRVKGHVQEEYGKLKEKESKVERDLDDLEKNRI